ncbi:MAG: TRAP transporter small permease [Burkholderiaceae bacterium]|jgi:TRAP-type C4-dicarboxylate transport system permease small subunit
MRRFLDRLYDGAGILAALCMAALLVTVLITIASREFDFRVSGIDGYAGYFMAACAFLALAHTFQRNEHIRVTLFLGLAKGRMRFWIELWALAASSLLSLLLAFFSLRLAWQSYVFKDVSTSMDATPLWIPQSAMAVGAVLFAVAVLDALVCHLRGKPFVTPATTQEFSHD